MKMEKMNAVYVVLGAILGLIAGIIASFFPTQSPYFEVKIGVLVWAVAVGSAILRQVMTPTEEFLRKDTAEGQELAQYLEDETFIEKAERAARIGDFQLSIYYYEQCIDQRQTSEPEHVALEIARLYLDELEKPRMANIWYRKSIALACNSTEGSCSDLDVVRESAQSLREIRALNEDQQDIPPV